MSPEDLDKARAAEAWRVSGLNPANPDGAVIIAARLAREGWQPAPKPSPRVMAMRKWLKAQDGRRHLMKFINEGDLDNGDLSQAFLAGYAAAVKEAHPAINLLSDLAASNFVPRLTAQEIHQAITTYLTAIGEETSATRRNYQSPRRFADSVNGGLT